ncbi:reverse transcriptase [Tanacetum coccineum]
MHQEKVHQEKLKAVKARLNFEEVSQYSESGTPSRRRDLRRRLGSKCVRKVSGSPEPRRGRSESPRIRDPKRRTVFKRLKNGVFHRLGDKEKGMSAYSGDSRHQSYHSSQRDTKSCYQGSRSRGTEPASKKNHSKRASSRKTEALSEGEYSAGGHWKSRSKKQKSSIEDEDLSHPQQQKFPRIIRKTTSSNKKKRSCFHFKSLWTSHEDCENIIRSSWPMLEVDNQLVGIKHNLSFCATKLKQWSLATFGNNRRKIDDLTKELQIIQTLPHTPGNFYRQRTLLQELETTWLREEMFWHQRSRINWLNYGDCNSRFFHLNAIQRGLRNSVSGLIISQGEWVYDHEGIQRLVQDHFKAIYKTSGARNFDDVISVLNPVVSETMNIQLQSCVSDSKIIKATKQLGGIKAPGEDGFPGMFYQQYWNLIGSSVCKSIHFFFKTGNMLPELNKTLVVLIPKTSSPETLAPFRPISLCNFIYKIISKVLANRLKPLMSKIISPQQSAFIPERQIQDCMVVANEAFHYIRNKKRGKQNVMALKVDLNKAFDRVEWDFLLAVL